MGTVLRILILEDSPHDAELAVATLESAGYRCEWERVDTRAVFQARLHAPAYDLIFADYNLPSFDGLSALSLVRGQGVDIPFILISGTLGEERAIESLKAGATDYVLKTRLVRLVPVVERALRERHERRRRQAAEEALHHSERRFRSLASRAPVGIFLTDARGNCVFVNDRWCAMAARTPDAAIGQPWCHPIHPEDLERVRTEWAAAVQSGQEYLSEYRFQGPDGTPTWLHGSIIALHHEAGEVSGYLGTVTDITGHKRVEEELRRVTRLKADFVATMSHELRSPLHVIIGYNDLLLDGAFGPVATKQIEPLRTVGQRALDLLDLINATLNVSILEKGQVAMDLREICIADLLSEIEDASSYATTNPDVRFVRDVPPDLPPVRTDPAKFKIVLRNLLANAFKFTPAGTVTVGVRRVGEDMQLTVADTGIGIAPEVLPIIFDPFRQGDSSMTRRYGGVGLGLYIVRRLLEMMGGTITVASQVGQGTQFSVRLPAAPPG